MSDNSEQGKKKEWTNHLNSQKGGDATAELPSRKRNADKQ